MGWIVDEMRGNLAQRAQYFFNPADEVGSELRFGGSVDLGDPPMDARRPRRCSSTPSPSMPNPGLSLASAYRAALEWADDAGRAIA